MALKKKSENAPGGKKIFTFRREKPAHEKKSAEKQGLQKKTKKEQSSMEKNNFLLNLISPINLNFERNYLEIGENFAKVYGIIRYPDKVDVGWLSKITNIPSTVVSMSIRPVDSALLLNTISKNIVMAAGEENAKDPLTRQRAEKIKKDNENLLYQIDQNNESVVKMGVTIMPFANNTEKLKSVTRSVESKCNLLKVKTRLLSNLQKQGFKSVAGTFGIEETIENITGRIVPLSTFVGGFPFSASGLNDMSGYYFAKDTNGGLIILDPWYRGEDRTNSNITILGVAGTGKTTATKHLIMGEFMRGTKVIIIDPEAEYVELVQNLGGDVINAGGSTKSKINVLQIKPSPKLDDDNLDDSDADDLYGDEISEMALHIKNLEIFFKLYKKDFSDSHIAYLKRELIELYQDFGISWDTDVSNFKNTDFPILKNLYEHLQNKRNTVKDEMLDELMLLLDDISNGSDSFIFNGYTTINPTSNIICLNTVNIQSSSEAVKKAQYFNLLGWAWEQLSKDRSERVMLVCDEAYLLIDPEVPQTAAFLRNVEKRCRKFEASLVVVSHSVIDFLHDSIKNYGQALLDIPTLKLIFGADGENLNQIDKLFKLNEAQRELLESKKRANALMMIGAKKLHIKFDIPEYKFKYFGGGSGR